MPLSPWKLTKTHQLACHHDHGRTQIWWKLERFLRKATKQVRKNRFCKEKSKTEKMRGKLRGDTNRFVSYFWHISHDAKWRPSKTFTFHLKTKRVWDCRPTSRHSKFWEFANNSKIWNMSLDSNWCSPYGLKWKAPWISVWCPRMSDHSCRIFDQHNNRRSKLMPRQNWTKIFGLWKWFQIL